MVIYNPDGGNYPPPPPPPPKDGGAGVQKPNIGPIVPVGGDVVRDQLEGIGKYSRGLVPKSFSLAAARPADQAKREPVPGNVLHVLMADGGAIPPDARISIGGSAYLPIVEGFVYETDEPFDGYEVYWPTAAAGVTMWIVVAFGRSTATRGIIG